MRELLDHVEAEAKANAAFHITNADNLTKESNTLVNLLLAGAGGSLAILIGLVQKSPAAPSWQVWAVGVAAAYLFLIAGLVIWRCLWVQDIWPPANEPKNFPLDGHTLDEIRQGDIANRQACIDLNRARNGAVGVWLNRSRALAAATPLATALAALAARAA